MAEDRVPHSWVGSEVEVAILVSAGFDLDRKFRRPVAAANMSGLLEAVTEEGIVGSFADEFDTIVLKMKVEPRSRFYTWSAVLSIQPLEDDEDGDEVAEVRPIR